MAIISAIVFFGGGVPHFVGTICHSTNVWESLFRYAPFYAQQQLPRSLRYKDSRCKMHFAFLILMVKILASVS
ncbi:MAG: hypothetical protein RIR11_2301 [Bacteroidota bacterium]